MAQNENQSIFIINQQGGYNSSGQEVTQSEYQAWVTDNDLQAIDQRGELVNVVGGTNKYSIATGLTPGVTSGYSQIEVNNFDAETIYENAVTESATITLTNEEVLGILQENIDTALALKQEAISQLISQGSDPATFTVSVPNGDIATTLVAIDAAIDLSYAALDRYKENPQEFVALAKADALESIKEYIQDVGLEISIGLGDLEPINSTAAAAGSGTSTTVGTTTNSLAISLASVNTSQETTIKANAVPTVLTGDDITKTNQASYFRNEAELANFIDVNAAPQTDLRATLVDIQTTLRTEKDLRDAASQTVIDYFGIDNPLGKSAVERAIALAVKQVPGVDTIRTVTGVVDRAIDINDIVTKNEVSAADLLVATLKIAALANPQLGLIVKGYEQLTNPDSLLNTAIRGGGAGGDELIVGGTFSAVYNSDTGTYDVVDDTNGDVVASGLTQEQANTEAQIASSGDPSYGYVPGSTTATAKSTSTSTTVGGIYVTKYNSDSGTWDVVDSTTGEVYAFGLTQEEADQTAKEATLMSDPYYDPRLGTTDTTINNTSTTVTDNTTNGPGTPYDNEGFLNPGWALDGFGNPVYVGGDYIDSVTTAQAAADRAAAALAAQTINARAQNIIQQQRKQANDGDWRVRLRLAPLADYLYKDPGLTSDGILWPLRATDGVIFPYTPQINTTYHANYNSYDLTHSNYRGYFYQNSYVGEVNIVATFTAQDTSEADYMLAVIHFFRSATKMFYGQDTAGRGSPPPLVYLQGLGEYQFNLHPCVISQFNYNLPNDVDYIRARSRSITGTSLQFKRDRQYVATNAFDAALQRLSSIGQSKGGINTPPAPPSLGLNNPTYVPTKLELQLTLLPTQSRDQVSNQFSLKNFANGNLLKGGFW